MLSFVEAFIGYFSRIRNPAKRTHDAKLEPLYQPLFSPVNGLEIESGVQFRENL